MSIFYKRISIGIKRIFFFYTIITTLFIGFAAYFVFISNNMTAYFVIARLHTIIEFSLLAYIFSNIYQNKGIGKISLWITVPFFLLCVYDYFSSETPSIAYKPLLTECIIFILAIIYFFFEKMKQEAEEFFFQTFIFWFAVALLINFSGNFLLFIYSETSNTNTDFKFNYTIIYSSVTILKNLLLCAAATMKDTTVKKTGNNFPDNFESTVFKKL